MSDFRPKINTIYLGDYLKLISSLTKVDMILCDPPYLYENTLLFPPLKVKHYIEKVEQCLIASLEKIRYLNF